MSACLQRKLVQQQPLHLLTAPSIFHVLQQQFAPLLAPGDRHHLVFLPLNPGRVTTLDGLQIRCRWNHHILPYGTLGLKMTAGTSVWGLSGDTKFDRRLNQLLGRAELTEAWFADCHLVFHEVEYENPRSVHSFVTEVEYLRQTFSGPFYVYHTADTSSQMPIAQEGYTYRLQNHHLEIFPPPSSP